MREQDKEKEVIELGAETKVGDIKIRRGAGRRVKRAQPTARTKVKGKALKD